ncbi:MAG TPA: hypothetical protein VHM19_04195, partial [Polyangiales bacterium]|nr:hypothetical protein [Polyangiales bacterium]
MHDAGPGDAALIDAQSGPQSGGSGIGGHLDASLSSDAGRDAGQPQVGAGCKPNPNTLDEVCTQICPEVCDGQDNDCDRRIDEDAQLCAVAHSRAVCTEGACHVTACLDGYRDCNTAAADGCEVAPSDPNHCGLCKHVCALQNADATCVNGECKVAKCDSGFGDCDGDGESCETPLDTLTDCGGCASTGDNVACQSLPNATTTCSDGLCKVAKCIGNFGDCDADGLSCETELNVTNHCGSCTQTCSLPGANASCATGDCLATTCKAGYDECAGGPSNGCESLSAPDSCGGCNKHCGPSTDQSVDNHVLAATCSNQVCSITSCAPGFANCDSDPFNGCETDTHTEQNCGGCGVICDSNDFPNADVSCASGTCTFVACKGGYGDCSGGTADGCETKLDVLAHCGNCGHACTAGQFCTGGTCSNLDCSAAPHNADCGAAKCADCNADGTDCERNVATDLQSCGACGNVCAFNAGPTPVGTLLCADGVCGVSCPADYADCDGDYRNGCEKSLTTLASCGACGVGCSIPNATATCASVPAGNRAACSPVSARASAGFTPRASFARASKCASDSTRSDTGRA